MINDPSKCVPPHGLYHRMAVLTGGKPRSHSHHHWGIRDAGAQVALGQDRIYNRIRPKYGDAPALWVC